MPTPFNSQVVGEAMSTFDREVAPQPKCRNHLSTTRLIAGTEKNTVGQRTPHIDFATIQRKNPQIRPIPYQNTARYLGFLQENLQVTIARSQHYNTPYSFLQRYQSRPMHPSDAYKSISVGAVRTSVKMAAIGSERERLDAGCLACTGQPPVAALVDRWQSAAHVSRARAIAPLCLSRGLLELCLLVRLALWYPSRLFGKCREGMLPLRMRRLICMGGLT
ncbi:hypothetical protein DFP72DRAFT_1129680 [Ephemerocybe angulata]|uniref:Uncharacterized protein n=1 Tax=Ephemerocybe angulata TaxID=980116 RepID=A0A8H6IHE7_9AGAR|nr:hypothetical protein DFP72DRAFT_1129680 [Tulosesus angulatus]